MAVPSARRLVGEKKQVVALAPVGDLGKTAVELDGQIRLQALELTPCAVVYIERTRVGSGGDRRRRRHAREKADFANWRSAPGRDPERGRQLALDADLDLAVGQQVHVDGQETFCP